MPLATRLPRCARNDEPGIREQPAHIDRTYGQAQNDGNSGATIYRTSSSGLCHSGGMELTLHALTGGGPDMAFPERMKFGIFLGPFHRVGENPTLAMERDLELIEWLDKLGFDEAWIGEHHSAGWEIHLVAGGVHCRRGPAHQPHQAGHGRGEPAVSPPADGGQPHGAAGPHDLRPRAVRSRPGRAPRRRLHDGHSTRTATGAHGRVPGRHPAPVHRNRADQLQERLV